MENANDIKISIPKPCHEDWNKMTPNEQGAFCLKCSKTVVDFTKKTTEEIKNFLLGQNGKKVCGRFNTTQLDESPKKIIDLLIPIHLLPKKLSFNRAFIFALFISFGTTLFSCSTQQGEVVGKIAPLIDTTKIITAAPTTTEKITGDTIYNMIETTAPVKKTVSTEKICNTLKGDVAIEKMQGEVVATPKDTVQPKGEIKTGKVKID